MSQLFDALAALDRKIANRWKIRTHDNVRHVLTAADIDSSSPISSDPRVELATRIGIEVPVPELEAGI